MPDPHYVAGVLTDMSREAGFVRATLISSGRPLTLTEICLHSGLNENEALKGITELLRQEYLKLSG